MLPSDYSCDYTIKSDTENGRCTIFFRCFDTPNSITVYADEPCDASCAALLVGLWEKCIEFHELWSFTLPTSDVTRLNEPVGSIEVDPRTAALVQAMKDFGKVEPLFDFTIGPLSFLWKHATRMPSDEEIAEAMSRVGEEHVSVQASLVVKDDPRVQIDVGGAAKGAIADTLADELRAVGVSCAEIDLGGNLYMLGEHPHGRPWRVEVTLPEGVETERILLPVTDASVVTSGSYERFVEIDGVRYQHIDDPRTGWPSTSDIVSVTVVAESSLEADMLATTALIGGSSELPALAARHPSCSFIAILDDSSVLRLQGRDSLRPLIRAAPC